MYNRFYYYQQINKAPEKDGNRKKIYLIGF